MKFKVLNNCHLNEFEIVHSVTSLRIGRIPHKFGTPACRTSGAVSMSAYTMTTIKCPNFLTIIWNGESSAHLCRKVSTWCAGLYPFEMIDRGRGHSIVVVVKTLCLIWAISVVFYSLSMTSLFVLCDY